MVFFLTRARDLFLDYVLVCGRPKDAPLFVAGDIEGFFCLFMNTLLDFTLLITLGKTLGMSKHYVQENLIPGSGLVCLLGNLYYTWEARRLMRKEERHDVTAQPFGIATPSLIGFFTLVFSPLVKLHHESVENALDTTLQCCFVTGVLYLSGSFLGPILIKHLPQAAHMGALATIGFSILAVPYTFEIFARPLLAIPPCLLFLFLVTGKVKLPFSIPYGLVVIVVGCSIGWILRWVGSDEWPRTYSIDAFQYFYPKPRFEFLTNSWMYCFKMGSIVVPLAIVNIISIVQTIAGAKDQSGDNFNSFHSFIVNGILTSFGCFFGNPIPTVIYIGQPTFKDLGARAGYSAINGVVLYALCSFGCIGYILDYMPQDAIISILLYIGLDITVAAMTHVPRNHSIAIAIALLPGIAKMASINFESILVAANSYLTDPGMRVSGICHLENNVTIPCNVSFSSSEHVVTPEDLDTFFHGSFFLSGVNSLTEGYLITSMLLGAVVASFIEQKRLAGAVYLLILTITTWVGLTHGWEYDEHGQIISLIIGTDGKWIISPPFVICYASCSLMLFLLYFFNRFMSSRLGKKNEISPETSGSTTTTTTAKQNKSKSNVRGGDEITCVYESHSTTDDDVFDINDQTPLLGSTRNRNASSSSSNDTSNGCYDNGNVVVNF